MGDHDSGWYSIPLGAQYGEVVPTTEKRTQDGEATVLLAGDVSLLKTIVNFSRWVEPRCTYGI